MEDKEIKNRLGITIISFVLILVIFIYYQIEIKKYPEIIAMPVLIGILIVFMGPVFDEMIKGKLFENNKKETEEETAYKILRYFFGRGKTLDEYNRENSNSFREQEILFDRLIRTKLLQLTGISYGPIDGDEYTFRTGRYLSHMIFTTDQGYLWLKTYEQSTLNNEMKKIADSQSKLAIASLIIAIIALVFSLK